MEAVCSFIESKQLLKNTCWQIQEGSKKSQVHPKHYPAFFVSLPEYGLSNKPWEATVTKTEGYDDFEKEL